MRCAVLKHTGKNMNLESQIKQLIIDSLGLEDITEADIDTDALVNLFEIEPERIAPDTNLYEDLEIDSIDAIDLIDYIKRQTGRKLLADDFRSVRTVEDVVQAVLRKDAAQ